jgi:YD repeat-containing protein
MWEYLFVWIGLSVVVAVAANSRGRNQGGWLLLSLVISPLIAGLLLFALPKLEKQMRDLRKCPACAEWVKREARICKHCGRELPPLVIEVESNEARAARLKRQDRQAVVGAVIAVGLIFGLFALMAVAAKAGEQTRFYGPDGRSLGTAAPQGQGTVRYYDAQGRSLGTSTTTGNTTTFYGPRGNVTGRTVGPSGPVFPSRR